jgi:hypothetical protein
MYTIKYPTANTISILINGWSCLNLLAVHWEFVQYTKTANATEMAANPHTIFTGWIILKKKKSQLLLNKQTISCSQIHMFILYAVCILTYKMI